MMTFEDFAAFVKKSFPEVTEEQMNMFQKMEGAYNEWNAKINVISRKDIGGLYDHHVLHSLAIARYLKEMKPEIYSLFQNGSIGKVLDLGTGGGFPGIPLAVMFPKVDFVLCDSIKKKTLVAQSVAELLALKNVTIVNSRAEELGESFDYVVSRAVASLTDFYPWVKGQFTKSILYLKGGDINEEICNLMQQEKMKKGGINTWPVDSWLQNEYFQEKFVVEIER